ncbi:MAG: Rossman fold protein, TIGR00730 family [Gammaproteobacteria bacterium RIFCSPHIGHO2_12_FULL_40_19]|nr:MAG: Rossman fold protein, TIGR00730 family [Gammaproteobacteria bacterium RIFCSPHIGHO2_12_FULL_40_19]
MIKKICVFIGASLGSNQQYIETTKQLAKALVLRNLSIVYGGANNGLMGVLADTALALAGEVIGVIPNVLAEKEIAHKGLTQLHPVNSMIDRKKLLFELSDAFIILPGGLGTLEELFEVWNAAKIGLHQKRIGLLNVDGYFNALLEFLKNSEIKGFLKQSHLDLISISHDPSEILDDLIMK